MACWAERSSDRMPLLCVTRNDPGASDPSLRIVKVTATCGAVLYRAVHRIGLPVPRHSSLQQVGIPAELLTEWRSGPDTHSAGARLGKHRAAERLAHGAVDLILRVGLLLAELVHGRRLGGVFPEGVLTRNPDRIRRDFLGFRLGLRLGFRLWAAAWATTIRYRWPQDSAVRFAAPAGSVLVTLTATAPNPPPLGDPILMWKCDCNAAYPSSAPAAETCRSTEPANHFRHRFFLIESVDMRGHGYLRPFSAESSGCVTTLT